MKTLKGRYDLLLYFLFPGWILVSTLYLVYPDMFALTSLMNWLLIASLLLFTLLPSSSIRLGGSDQSGCSGVKWIMQLFLSQLVVALFVWSTWKIITKDLTIGIIPSFTQFSLYSGLFPAGFMIFLTLTAGYFTYNKGYLGLLSSAYKPLFNNTHLDSTGIVVDTYTRYITFFALIVIFAMLILTFILVLQHFFPFQIMTGLQFNVLLVTSALLFVATHKLCAKCLHQLTRLNWSTLITLLSFSLMIALLYPLLSLISQGLAYLNPLLNHSLSYRPANQANQAIIIITFWWLTFCFLNGAYIATVSRSFTLRQIIIGSLLTFFPVIGIIMLLEQIPGLLLPEGLLITSGIILAAIMLSSKYFTYFHRATLPTKEPIKIRSTFRFLKMFPFIIIIFLCGYFLLPISIWSYFTILTIVPSFIIITISYLSFMKEIVSSIHGKE